MAKTIKLPFSRFGLAELIDLMGITEGVEVGVNHGYFSYHLLKNSSLKTLWSVDSWVGKFAPPMKDAVRILSEFGERSVVKHMASVDGVADALSRNHRFGFIYIDGNHRESAVREDIGAWLPLLQRPGILAGHDYARAKKCGVIEAVQEAADNLDAPVFLTSEPRLASWMFLFGEE
jgi:predicted O-methyltransferase YrrM